MSDHATSPRHLLLGQVTRPHGVRGELRVRLLTDYPERISELDHVFLGTGAEDAGAKRYTVSSMRMHQGYGLLTLEEIIDRNDADRLRKLYVMVPFEDAVPLEEGEFYLFQVIGLRVETDSGQTLGTVKNVLETGANDVYVINSPEYGEILFPATEETIIKHDIDNGIVHVHLLDGLLPDKK